MNFVSARLRVLILTASLLSVSCAMITMRPTQRIPVTSSPAGATVFLNGVEQGRTPVVLRLPRKEAGQVIRIESPGYDPIKIRLTRKPSALAIVSDVLMGAFLGLPLATAGAGSFDTLVERLEKTWPWIPGMAIALPLLDVGAGKRYVLSPKNLTVTLTRTDGPPRAETILVDADDFQNVKWIRVRRD